MVRLVVLASLTSKGHYIKNLELSASIYRGQYELFFWLTLLMALLKRGSLGHRCRQILLVEEVGRSFGVHRLPHGY